MTQPPTDAPTTPASAPSNGAIAALLLALPAIALVLGGALLPRPAGTDEARASVDRKALGGLVLQRAPALNAEVDARLASAQVLGANVPRGPLKPGDPLAIDFYFKATAQTDLNWRIFLHIDRKGATYRIHGDHDPVRGRYPTSLWQVGEIIKDPFKTKVPADAPAGTYDIWMGFYIGDERMKWVGGDRAVHDGKNRVRVGTLAVAP